MTVIPFVHEGLGNSSYLLGCGGDRALLVDPDRSIGRYLEAAGSRGWTIIATFETHLHADFVTGCLEAHHATGATIYLPDAAKAAFPHRGVLAGDRLEVGDLEVEAIASPGHAPEHLSYVVRGPDGPPALFSGGALIVGGAARTDLIDPGSTERLTRAEFHTLRDSFSDLLDETLLFPTHGGGSFCSVTSGGDRTSTLGAERRTNPVLAAEDEDGFVRSFIASFPAAPTYFFRMREVNRSGPPLRETIAGPAPLAPDAFDRARADGARVIDVRAVAEYSEVHVPGSLSNPLRDAYATWLGWLVAPETPLLFVHDGVAVDRVIDESLLVGFERFAGFLDGGMQAWVSASKPVERVRLVDARGAMDVLDDGAVALDVREPDEYARSHVDGAVHVPLGELEGRLGELPRGGALLVYCGHGERASTGASILERAGFEPVLNLRGGFGAWRKAGLRVS